MSNRNATVENALMFFLLAFAVMAKTVFSQHCQSTGCPGLKECCSSWGSCGIKDDQCGFWCFSGPCNLKNKSYGFDYNVSAGPRGPIESIVTPSLFKRIMGKVGNNCPAKGFYTHQAFISAAKSFQAYKGTVAKREIAAILSHFAHGSKGFCYKEDKARGKYCSPSKKYPCEPGKQYYGRGPLQSIRWNEYYGAASIFLRLPLLKDPDRVAQSPEVAFKLALWFWTTNVRPALYLGFGETSKRVDGRLCDNLYPDDNRNLVKQYVDLCKILGVTPDEDFCYIEEINGASGDYCDESNRQYPCAPGKGYFGRGPIQLSWNYNYGACGQSLNLNLLGQPELVSSNPTVAFRTGLWFWMNSVRPVLNQGFGATIRAINGMECNGGNSGAVNARIRYYRDYCGQLGVDPGPNLSC
ncbi:hypothetical protein Bca52824_003375 [Brassica carinata]|uniref:Glycoside hydrolase family 19 catalytic domain-containing protein n=1 Tax=Brassica carinata TaxID=52824 RepID=A0A8X7WMX6_BRACI|nr:hypothetical protein Bca52824_003375 [Brassica carinata]